MSGGRTKSVPIYLLCILFHITVKKGNKSDYFSILKLTVYNEVVTLLSALNMSNATYL